MPEHILTDTERSALNSAAMAVVVAKANGYDVRLRLEQAEKEVALAEAGQRAVITALAMAAGFKGDVRVIGGEKIVGE